MAGEGVTGTFRLLVIEDDAGRVKMLRDWLPEEIKLVVAPSAGTAIGILKRDRGNVYGGIMLDHDLQQRAMTSMDRTLSGTDVAQTIIDTVSPDVPVLIHSMNSAGSTLMAAILQKAGFEVTRVPIDELDRKKLTEWMEEAYGLWEDTL